MSRTNPVPRGFADQAGTATAPTRCSAGAYDPHTAAHLTPGEVDALLAALRRQRDRAIVLGGLRLRGPRIAFGGSARRATAGVHRRGQERASADRAGLGTVLHRRGCLSRGRTTGRYRHEPAV